MWMCPFAHLGLGPLSSHPHVPVPLVLSWCLEISPAPPLVLARPLTGRGLGCTSGHGGVGREKRKGCRRSMDTPRSTQAKSPCDELILGKCMLTCPCLIYVMTNYSKAHIYLTGLVFSRGTACLFTRLEVCVALTFSRS